jgi:predicted unusual protein kinase regulating ubiquinone biosynthesis (AarF/ABC1/UbiB family)
MSTTVSELLTALPDEERAQRTLRKDPRFRQIYEELAHRPVPVGQMGRLWVLTGLNAQIAMAYVFQWVRGWFASADEQERRRLETHLEVAFKLLETMGYLRGAVLKAGQTIANFRDLVPDEIVTTLSRLHFEAPPMHFSLLREQVHSELNGDPEEIFAEFDTEPFAAASLGQVHRARLKTGEEVAVKIQYPGIARTIRSDLRNILALLTPLRLTKDFENAKQQLLMLFQTLELETDYEHEARLTEAARALFREDDGIVVPRVFSQYSTRRVLTLEFIEGQHVDRFLESNPSQELRNHFAEKIMRAWYRLLFRGRMDYIDWHPGNFLFGDDGRLGLIDFGCVCEMADSDVEWERRADKFMQTKDRAELMAFVREWCGLDDSPHNEEWLRLAAESAELWWAPRLQDGPYDYADPEPLRRSVQLFGEMTRKRYTRAQPITPLFSRQDFGNRTLFHRMKARIDIHPIRDEEVQATGWEHVR